MIFLFLNSFARFERLVSIFLFFCVHFTFANTKLRHQTPNKATNFKLKNESSAGIRNGIYYHFVRYTYMFTNYPFVYSMVLIHENTSSKWRIDLTAVLRCFHCLAAIEICALSEVCNCDKDILNLATFVRIHSWSH